MNVNTNTKKKKYKKHHKLLPPLIKICVLFKIEVLCIDGGGQYTSVKTDSCRKKNISNNNNRTIEKI